MAKAIEIVLEHVELRPLPMLECPSAIPKNTPVMNPAPQAVMISPTHQSHVNSDSSFNLLIFCDLTCTTHVSRLGTRMSVSARLGRLH